MEIFRVPRAQASEARGIVIVIDVIRAFTVAGYAFAGGARKLWLVRTVEEAFSLRKREPDALLIGEVGGRLIPGFDLNNSPALMAQKDVRDRILIQRTGAGTQGAVGAFNASSTLLCAFTNAVATANYARRLATSTDAVITLLPTASSNVTVSPNEDDVCADYLEALLNEQVNASEILQKGLAYLETIDRFHDWRQGDPDLPLQDIEAVLDLNRFPFAIQGHAHEWQGITYVEAERIDLTSP